MSTTKEKAVAAAMEAAKSGASFRESVNIGKAVMNGGSSGGSSRNSSSGGGSTPAASNGRTSGGYAHQSYKDKQAEIQRRNEKSYLDAALNIDNTVHGELLKDAVAADKKAKEEAAKHDNSAGWQQYRDNVNNPSLEYAEGLMEEYRNASDKENEAYGKKKLVENNNPTEAALVGFLYDDEIAAAQKERESAAQRLAEIGIGTNGTQIYADDFYKSYFDSKAAQAKESGASTEHDPTNYISGGTGSIDSAKKTSDWATDDEVQMYNHLVAQDKKNGTNHAEVYKRYMEGVLNRRQAGARADEIRSMGKGSGKDLLMGWEAMKAGASGAMNDLGATLRGVPQGHTVSEYTAQELRQDLVDQDRGTMLFDAAQSIGAMAPGIAAGAINPLLGTAVFGATSGASGYQDKLAEGWNQQDAMAYGVLTGASEAALEKVLGGISALGGRSGGIITGLTGKINNAIAKAVLNGAGRAFSEGSEEAIQTFIEPAIESIVRGVDYEAPGADEVIYNAIMGAITSAMLGVPEFAGDIASGRQQASGSPNSAANQSAIDGDSILGATSLGDILAVAQSRADMDKASAKIRSDEAMLNELQQTVGRPLSGNNDIKSALLELQTKVAVEQKISAAVAEGTPQAIEKALMEIASNPRELNILNKYYGNLPGTVEGNIDFAKKVANGQAVAKPTEAAAPANVDEGQEVRNIIDQMAGIAPVAEQATESSVKAQEFAGGQVTPVTTQKAEQVASERLNQQENADDLPFVMNDDNIEADNRTGGYSDVYTYGNNQNQSVDSRGREESRVDGYNQEKQRQPRSRVSKAAIEENLRSGARLIQDSEYSEANQNTASIAKKLGAKDFGIFDTAKAKNFLGGKGRSTVDNVTGESYTSIAKGGDPGVASEGQVCAHECTHDAIARTKWENAIKFGDEFVLRHPEAEKARRWFKQEHGEMYAEEMYDRSYYDLTPEQCEAVDAKIYEELFCDLVAHITRAFDGTDISALSKEVESMLVSDGVFPEGTFGPEYDALIESSIAFAEKDWSEQTQANRGAIDANRTIDIPSMQYGSEPQQPSPNHQPTDDAELTALQIDDEREAANSDAELYQKMAETKAQTNSSGQYIQQQRDAEREAQRQREQEGLPKYDVAHEYGSDTVAKFSDFDSRIGNLVDEQRVFKDGKSEGTKESKSVSRLNNGKEILNMARDVMRGELSIQDFANEYYAIENSASGYLYTEDIAKAFQEAVRDVSPTRNTDFTQVTQEKKAKDITSAMQMLVHRAEKAAEYKIVSSNLSKQIRNNKSKASSIALGRYFDVQATPDTFFKAIGGFDRNVNTEAYALADEALENNATEKRERSAGYSFFTDVTKHKDFDAFAKNSLMSGYTVNNVELTAQEAVSLLHSLRSIREQTNDYFEGSPDTISVDRDGETVTIFSVSGKAKNRSNALKNLEEEIESHVTGIAKEYSDALDKMFAHYSPKFLNAIKDSTGLDREAAPEGKYFPLFYRDGSDGVTFNIAEALQSRFEKLGFAKERTGPGSALQIAPAAQVADNYIEQVSHYIGWASFSNKLNMLNSNIDGTGSFLSTISDVYSPKTAKLMADYIRDVGGYKASDSDNWFNQLLGRFAGAVITGRPSTAFSQLSSVYAAGGIIKPEAIRQAGVVFPAKRKYVNLDDGLLADRARHGMNDSTISEITRNADSKIKNAIEKIPGGKTYLNLVGIADSYTTKQLYAACWCDVRMDYPDIQKSNPKLFDTLVEDKFMEAVLFSQSDSDRINNAAIYRSNNYWYRATSLFTGQPNKQLNMVMTALGEYNAAKGTAKKEAAKTLANTVRGQAGAAVSYAVLKTVANLILHKWYDLKDEDDELSVKEIGEAVLSESISTMFGMLRFGEWTTDRLMHLITDGNLGNDFDFQINGISQMFGLAENAMNILGIANGNVPTVKEIKDFAVSVSNVTGAPLQGAYDFANMLSLWGIDIYNAVVKDEKPKGNYDIAGVIDKKVSEERELSNRLTGQTPLQNTIDALTGNAPTVERQGAQDALLSLYEETGEDSALPPEFSGKINDDIKLTGDEKEKYQDNLLNLFYGNFEAVYSTDLYKDADTETKQAIVSTIKEFSTDQAKQKYYKAVGIEKESEYKILLEGKDVPGHLEDGSPKPDIEPISIKDIPEYLANKVIYAQAQDKKDFDAIDDFLNNFENMPDNYKQQLTNSYSEINTLIEAKNEFNVDSENFYSVKDSIADKAKEYDETAENAKSKMSGIYNADVDDGIKDSMAEMLLSKDSYAFYMAAKSTDSGDPASLFANITFNDNEINQAEAKIAVQNDPKLEELMRAWWKNKGYKTSWEKKKVTAEEWDEYYNKYH